MGAAPLVDRFEREAGVQATAAVEAATLRTTGVAVYTLITWSVFIAGSRRAFVRRSPRPLAPVLPMTAILAAIRPWTVGDFSTLWITGVATGNIVAIGSLAAWVLVFSWLIVSDLRAVRRQRSIDTGPHAA
jgi:hypothetical protein